MSVLVLYNEYSGNCSKEIIDYIYSRLKCKFNEIVIYRSEGANLITEYVKTNGYKYSYILVCGGDGTINEVINGVMFLNTKPKLGFIPLGTCNDVCKNLGVSFNLKKAVDIFLEDYSLKSNVFRVNDKYSLYGCAIGNLTDVSYKASYRLKKIFGKLAYYFECFKYCFKSERYSLYLSLNDKKICGNFFMLLCLNTRYLASFKIKGNILNGNKFDVVGIKYQNNIVNIFDFFMFLLFGSKYKHNIVRFKCKNLFINSKNDFIVNLDGEFGVNSDCIYVEVLKNEIEVICNKKIYNKNSLN